MLHNYLKTAFRALWRSKVHTLINIFGLSIGVAACVLIVFFIKDELTFDRFHSKASQIYRAYVKEDYGENQQFFNTTTPFPLGPVIRENFEEVEAVVRISNISSQVKVQDNLFSEIVTIAGGDFLNVFDFDLKSGDRRTALAEQSNVLITEEAALRYFGTTDVINRVMSLQLGDRFEDFAIKGILANPASNSSIRFSVVIADSNYPTLYSENVLSSGWFNVTPETYVLLKENVNAESLVKKFPTLFKTLLGEDYERSKYFVGLQPLTSIHLDISFPRGIAPVNDPKYSYILGAIAALVLFVACINFITLSVGNSLKRAKEVGIRKVVGAVRKQLVFQFIGEAVVVTIVSVTIGWLIAWLGLPVFNDVAGKMLIMDFDGFLAAVICALVLIIGLFAGSYPAFVLSGFAPVTMLKGSAKSGDSRQGMRKVLVGVQLVLSIFLISSTLIMYRQLNFLQNKDLGFNKDQLLVLQLNSERVGRLPERVKDAFQKAEQFKSSLAGIRGVATVCASSHDFGNGSWTNIGYTDDMGTYRNFNINVVDDDYIPSMKMSMVAGRNFSDENPSDARRAIIVNESFVKEYGWTQPIGQRIPGKNFIEHEIIGVVKDFHYESLYNTVSPLLLTIDPMIPLSGTENISIDNSPIPKLLIRLRAGEITSTMNEIRLVWEKLTGGEEFAFNFVDRNLEAQYRNDQNLGRIVSYASLLAIVIASLGLYALASLTLQNRTKEISIRKVLGADEGSLLFLLSKEYLYLIAISLIISIPVTWYLMTGWLSSFQYKVGIRADVFILAGIMALTIALVTIGYQVLKTAWTQPARTLKYE